MMQIKKQKIINTIIIIIPTILAGIIIGKLFDWPFFKLDKNISIGDVFSLLITFTIAYVIAKVVEKEKLDNREGKNLIINRLDDVFHLIDDTSVKIDTENLFYPEAASLMKRIYSNFESIFRAINKLSIKLNYIDSNTVLQKIIQLRRLLTDSPKVEDTTARIFSLPLEVKDNKIYFSKSREIEINKEFEALKNMIFELQIEINLF